MGSEEAIDANRAGIAFARQRQYAQAIDSFQQALSLDPGFAFAHNNLGVVLLETGKVQPAIDSFEAALEVSPDYAEAHHNLGCALRRLGRQADAIDHLQRALALKPDYPDAHNNLGIAWLDIGEPAKAASSFQRALAQRPHFPEALSNYGNAFRALGKLEEARRHYEAAIAQQPEDANAHYNLGVLELSIGATAAAIDCFSRAVSLQPQFAAAHLNLGFALAYGNRHKKAVASFTRVLELDPANNLARTRRMYQLARLCDWDALEPEREWLPVLGIEGDVVPPFALLAFEDEPARHRRRSERFAAATYRVPASPAPVPERRSGPLHIGYFSADFYDHATMVLAASLFELHDRARFKVSAFSYGPAADGQMRERALQAFDCFHDINALDDAGAAAKARSDGLDIAIDLKGYTKDHRLGIFAHRAAPLQVTFLGYPGTTGAPFIDYMVADHVVVPGEQRAHYSEKLILLPHCYQPNGRRVVAPDVPHRAQAGLPAAGFVFCCFNNSYKITPREFSIWMRLLQKVEGSVLWLLETNGTVKRNLRLQAERRAVDPDRLVFAGRAEMAEHMARHALADLFLDTFAYNAHTTASDALWAGLPLVTRIGEGFAARVAASVLTAAGVSELVTASDEDYEALALDLARNPERLAAIRRRLSAERDSMPLFDSEAFTRALETGYEAAFERLLKGEPPADIAV